MKSICLCQNVVLYTWHLRQMNSGITDYQALGWIASSVFFACALWWDGSVWMLHKSSCHICWDTIIGHSFLRCNAVFCVQQKKKNSDNFTNRFCVIKQCCLNMELITVKTETHLGLYNMLHLEAVTLLI